MIDKEIIGLEVTEGVCLFDGITYTYFTKSDGLSDNQIRTIQEDQNGVIWFGTGNGVSSYKKGVIKDQTSIIIQPNAENNWALAETDIWFNAGNKSGVYQFNGQELSYLAFPIQKNAPPYGSFGVTEFSKGINGKLWIATYSAVFGYDGKSFEIINDKFLGYTKGSKQLHIRSILADSKGNLWIGNNGIGVLLKRKGSIINFSEKAGLVHANSLGNGGLSPAGTLEHVFVIEEDNQGNIWFGDRDTGTWKFDGKSMTNYKVNNKVSNNMVWTIYKDKNGDLLFGMDAGGVYKFNGKSFERKY